jgi:hypothetical protein
MRSNKKAFPHAFIALKPLAMISAPLVRGFVLIHAPI